jgi:Zn-dependent protease with chaperone function
MVIAAVAVVVLAWAGLWVALFRLVRNRALRIEHSSSDVPEKVHRLQRLMLTSVGSVVGVYVLIGAISAAFAAGHSQTHHHHSSGGAAALGVVVAVIVVAAITVPFIAMSVVVRRSLARVRDVPLKTPDRRRNLLAGLAIGVVYGAMLVGGNLLIPRHGTGHAVGKVLVYVIAIWVLTSVLSPLVLVRTMTKPLPASVQKRLRHLADEVGVRVRDFRVLKGRSQKVANAAQLGTLPGLRYIVITDYLVDHLDDEQLHAVIAHELGHARRHHLLIKLGSVFLVWGLLEALVIGIGHATGHGGLAVVAAPLVLVIPIGMILIQGIVGVRLEQAADDTAAKYVGPDQLAQALQKLAQLNDTKKNTGRAWSLITQHPGIQERIDRLRTSTVSRPPNAARHGIPVNAR